MNVATKNSSRDKKLLEKQHIAAKSSSRDKKLLEKQHVATKSSSSTHKKLLEKSNVGTNTKRARQVIVLSFLQIPLKLMSFLCIEKNVSLIFGRKVMCAISWGCCSPLRL